MAYNYMDSKFSRGFKNLMYMGSWTTDGLTKQSHKIIYYAYAVFIRLSVFTFIGLQVVDMYLVFGNFRKMIFNLCTSAIITGIVIKVFLLLYKKERMKSLCNNLWEDLNKCKNEDLPFFDVAYKELSFIRKIFWLGPMAVISLWGMSSYLSYKWGTRILPFAGFFPIRDINNDATYVPALLFELFIALLTSQTCMESDFAMFGILLQIRAHCKILNETLRKLNEVPDHYEGGIKGKLCKREINKHLRTNKILSALKVLLERHLELLKYCKDVEYVFNFAMALQLFGGSFILVIVGVDTTRVFRELNFSLMFNQTWYLIFVMMDLYIICYYFSVLAQEFTNTSYAAYCSSWYSMDVRIRMMLLIIMIRAQKQPRFTYGKLFIMDVNAYKHLIKNIYNWLMLFRQLEMK